MRIGIITNGYPSTPKDYWAGFCYDFALSLKKAGHEVFVFTPNRNAEKKNDSNISVRWFGWSGDKQIRPIGKLKFFNFFDFLKIFSLIKSGNHEIIKYIKQNNIELCIAMWAAPSGLFALHAKKKLSIPYFTWCLGSDIWIYARYPIIKNIIRKILRNAQKVYADGLKLCQDVEKISGGKCEFLATSRILPKVKETLPVIDVSKKNLLFIGRLEMVKGIDVLLDTMRLLCKTDGIDDIHLYIFGVGVLEDFVRQKIKDYELERFVFFKGYASSDTAALYLSQCDWLIIPSRNESIPVVFSDALQMGIPVIVSDVGDMGYLTRKHRVGEVARPDNAEDLRSVIRGAVFDDEKHGIYKANTKPLSRQFNIDFSARKFLQDAHNIFYGK